jgi:hypothetical protein
MENMGGILPAFPPVVEGATALAPRTPSRLEANEIASTGSADLSFAFQFLAIKTWRVSCDL